MRLPQEWNNKNVNMPVALGIPAVKEPEAVLAPRRKTRQIQVGNVKVGGDAPVSVQSMTTTKTHDIGATLQQIAELTASGCDIIRVACPTDKDADALPIIAAKSQIPVIADIHFQPRYVFAAIDAGCGVRVNRQHQNLTIEFQKSPLPLTPTAPPCESESMPDR